MKPTCLICDGSMIEASPDAFMCGNCFAKLQQEREERRRGLRPNPKGSVEFPSGATSSKIPRFDLIPRRALIRVARRFELGLEKHGEKSWNARSSQAALSDREFIIARISHVIDHALKLLAKIQGTMQEDGDDDAGAIAWGGLFLCEAEEDKKINA